MATISTPNSDLGLSIVPAFAVSLILGAARQIVGKGASDLITTPLKVITAPITLPLGLLTFPIVAPLSIISWPFLNPLKTAALIGVIGAGTFFGNRAPGDFLA